MATDNVRDLPDQNSSGVVELREDAPLRLGAGGGAGGGCARGPRLIGAAFAALAAAVTLALLTQIYYGDYEGVLGEKLMATDLMMATDEVVPHGAASSSSARCSRAGAAALRAGGRALDGAAAAALCLAVLAPHRTALDASGAMLYWQYRQSRTQPPLAVEWGGPAAGSEAGAGMGDRPPRLLAALATLHAQYGALPWARVLQPAVDLASGGFPVSEGLAAAGGGLVGTTATAPALADYLRALQRNTSAELSSWWAGSVHLSRGGALSLEVGGRRVWAGGPGAAPALAALGQALRAPPPDQRASLVQAMRAAGAAGGAGAVGGVAAGLAVVDRLDTYLALVTGLSTPFGNGAVQPEGWTMDTPRTALDLAPAILADQHVCGTRYVVGAEAWPALAQAALDLWDAAEADAGAGADAGATAVEKPRLALLPGGAFALEVTRPLPDLSVVSGAPLLNASQPYAAVNVVQQRADRLLSHADSRGGGLASRF